MIVVVAPYPSPENQKEGMMQRVAYIDALMRSSPRVYLELSFRRFFRKVVFVKGLVTIYHLNVFAHFFLIRKTLKTANIVYIHSAYNALKVMLFRTNAHLIFDAHGVVPEELRQTGQRVAAFTFAIAEYYILSHCDTLICVTNSMLKHFKTKVGDKLVCEEIVLPIIPNFYEKFSAEMVLETKRDPRSVIYAGGMQVWQNVDKMIEAVKIQRNLKYTFLTGDVEQFRARLTGVGLQCVECCSVPPEKVKNYYLSHDFGFVLRDDVLINQVACPTKLMEYLYWGIIPIVITPRIGDFDFESLHFIKYHDFVRGKYPDHETLDLMRKMNQMAVIDIIASAKENIEMLRGRLLQIC